MMPGEELVHEQFRDGLLGQEPVEQALSEELHDLFGIPSEQRAERPIRREAAGGREQVSMGMPLDEVAGGRDGDDEARPNLFTQALADGLGYGLRPREGQLVQQLAALAEERPQEARHGENDVTMRDGCEHFLLQPFRPQQLLLLLT
jgi:hypothetical protein